jgi:hypothetical protein
MWDSALGIDQLLIGRPLFLELLERCLVSDCSARLKAMNMNVHEPLGLPLVG